MIYLFFTLQLRGKLGSPLIYMTQYQIECGVLIKGIHTIFTTFSPLWHKTKIMLFKMTKKSSYLGSERSFFF